MSVTKVSNMNDSSIPDPALISFPWTESNRSVTLSSNRIPVQENLTANETMSVKGVASAATCLERNLPTVSPALRIENSNNTNIEKEIVCGCEKEKSGSHNPDCAGDHQGSQRKHIFHRSAESRRYQEVHGCKSLSSREDYADEVKSRHLFGGLEANRTLDDQTSDAVPESPVTARIPSPSSASSVTSGRRLEWDSGADVGYYFEGNYNHHSGASLSTIERIALAHGRSTGLFERLDPEGVCGPPKPVLVSQLSHGELDSPIAKSTPIYKSGNKAISESAEKVITAPIVEPPETVLPGGYLYLHSPEEFANEMAPLPRSGSEGQNEDSTDEDKVAMCDKLNKKNSNSLVNLNSSCEEIQSSVPRSKSYLNLLEKDNESVPPMERAVPPPRVLAGTCSVSSSSVATIVQRPIFPKTSDKFIQTLPLKLSVGVQVSESVDRSHLSQKISELSCDAVSSVATENDETKNQKGKINHYDSNVSQNHKCKGAHKKGSVDYNYCQNYPFQASNSSGNTNKSEKSSEKIHLNKESSQMEDFHPSEKGISKSAASSSQTVESCAEETSCSGMGIPQGTHVGSPGVADSTNSFEYLPGHVFDKASKHLSDASKLSAVSVMSANKVPLKSNTSREMYERSDSRSSSLSKDIEEGVELLQKLMSEKSYNGKTKKKLIRLIVNKLVNTDYPEDHNDKQFQTDPLSHNVPWVPAAQNTQHLKVLQACHYLESGEGKSNQSYTLSSSERSNGKTVDSAMSEIHTSPSFCTPSGSVSVPGDNEQSQGETTEASSNIYESSRKHWKTPTSHTEEDFETNRAKFVKNSSPTPSLLHLCKSEHEKQLQWIRFEIDHLSQLKQLLEKQEGSKTRSNLVDHEHKFHKIKSVNKNCSHNSAFQRPKANGNNDWSKSTVKDNSSQGNASLKTFSSSSFRYQEPLPQSCHHPRALRGQSLPPQTRESGMRKTDKKKDLSTQTLSLESYVLDNGISNSGLKGVNGDDGQLNVFVQTSPKALEKHQEVLQEFPTVARISESARRSYESAVKCCCDCRKALEGLIKEKDEQLQKFCKCESTSLESNHLVTDTSYSSLRHSGSTTVSHTPESNKEDGKPLPQKHDIATETVVNKTAQTTPSLNDMPIIRPAWNQEISKDASRKVRDKFCPCCGLREKPVGPSERIHNQDKSKKRTDLKNKYSFVDEKGKHHTNCDVSVQTTNKEPLAYLLTFEPTCKENIRAQNNDMLPEIKLLVPVNQNRLEKEMRRKANFSTSKENQCPLKSVQPNQHNSNAIDEPYLAEARKKTQKFTLQDYLRANRPDYIQHADKRSQCLADLALLRDLRKQKRLELLAMRDQEHNEKPKEEYSSERIVFSCTAVPSKPKLTSRLMREQSRRKYHKTREIQNKFVEKKKKEDFKTNRLMAELFTKKLQKKVLKGVVNHSNSASIISNVP